MYSDCRTRSSIGSGSTFSPPRSTTVSLARPVIWISPFTVSVPMSPVSSQPSAASTAAVSPGRL